jgi:hypothetical protein
MPVCSFSSIILFCHKPKTVSEVCRYFYWIVLLKCGVSLGSRDSTGHKGLVRIEHVEVCIIEINYYPTLLVDMSV